MRLTEFERLLTDEFGRTQGAWVRHSHVLAGFGVTCDEAIERGDDPRDIWWALCEDFNIPPERQLGKDEPQRPLAP